MTNSLTYGSWRWQKQWRIELSPKLIWFLRSMTRSMKMLNSTLRIKSLESSKTWNIWKTDVRNKNDSQCKEKFSLCNPNQLLLILFKDRETTVQSSTMLHNRSRIWMNQSLIWTLPKHSLKGEEHLHLQVKKEAHQVTLIIKLQQSARIKKISIVLIQFQWLISKEKKLENSLVEKFVTFLQNLKSITQWDW